MRTPAASEYDQLVQRYFDQASSFWNDIYELPDVYALIHQERRALVRQRIRELRLPVGAQILEVGCGAGHLAVELAQQGFDVTAIDPAPSMVEYALERAREARVPLAASTGDTYDLYFPSESFDLVTAIGVLPWVGNVTGPLSEMARVTRPGGNVLVTMDNRWALHRFLDPRSSPLVIPIKRGLAHAAAAAGISPAKARARTMSVSALDRRFSLAGLRKVHGETLGFGPFTLFNRPLFSDETAKTLHHRLQTKARSGTPLLRSLGAQYIALLERPAKDSTS